MFNEKTTLNELFADIELEAKKLGIEVEELVKHYNRDITEFDWGADVASEIIE